MRAIKNFILLLTGLSLFLTACDKMDDLQTFEKGNNVTLTSSKTAVAPTAADSSTKVIDFNWTTPNYATDTSTYKFIVELDSTGKNFSRKVTRTISGSRTFS